MPNLNRVTLAGYLGGNPEMKKAGATTVTKFTLAVTDRWKDDAAEKQEHTNWIPITVFNGRGENLAEYIGKGSCVLVEGSLRVSQFQEEGERRYYTEVIASNVLFLDKKKEEKRTRPKAVK